MWSNEDTGITATQLPSALKLVKTSPAFPPRHLREHVCTLNQGVVKEESLGEHKNGKLANVIKPRSPVVVLRTIHVNHMCSILFHKWYFYIAPPEALTLAALIWTPIYGVFFSHRNLIFSPESRLSYKPSFHYILVADWWRTGGCGMAVADWFARFGS